MKALIIGAMGKELVNVLLLDPDYAEVVTGPASQWLFGFKQPPKAGSRSPSPILPPTNK